SPASLRMQVHDSEPKWCATPFLCGSLIRYSMPVYLGASLITLSARISTFSGIARPICCRRVLVLRCVGWRLLASEGTLLMYVEIFDEHRFRLAVRADRKIHPRADCVLARRLVRESVAIIVFQRERHFARTRDNCESTTFGNDFNVPKEIVCVGANICVTL